MAVSASMVKELRERTGLGMMDCKKALVEADGDIELAIENLRKSGQAKAAKKAGRIAADGRIEVVTNGDSTQVAIVEVNCETDFVGKSDDFAAFAKAVATTTMEEQPADLQALLGLSISPSTIEKAVEQIIMKLGESISIRRFRCDRDTDAVYGTYVHGERIGVIVKMKGGNEALAKDMAMHIAASKPVCVNPDDMPANIVEKEKEIFTEQAANSGKPAEIIEKMVTGKLNKFLAEATLIGQPFVKDPDTKVSKLLDAADAKVVWFERYEVGEGIEKKQDNFVEEVMQQARGN